MGYALQCCVRCGELERGDTGPADRYLCRSCYQAGHRVDIAGNQFQVLIYVVHTWDSDRSLWNAEPPAIEAATPRDAFLAARSRHPGHTVHVARVLTEPCSPGGPRR